MCQPIYCGAFMRCVCVCPYTWVLLMYTQRCVRVCELVFKGGRPVAENVEELC